VEVRTFKLEGSMLYYYKKPTDKKGKKIELNKAVVESMAESKQKFWIKITTAQKVTREVAAKTSTEQATWIAAMKKAAGGGSTASAPIASSQKAEDKKPKEVEKKGRKSR